MEEIGLSLSLFQLHPGEEPKRDIPDALLTNHRGLPSVLDGLFLPARDVGGKPMSALTALAKGFC